jgi:predicted amidohydrolase
MRLTIIQDEIHWADKAANLHKVENQLKALAGTTDLVVLPEMFTTGFCTDELQKRNRHARKAHTLQESLQTKG